MNSNENNGIKRLTRARLSICALILLLLVNTALAQEDAQWYEVEVIIFRQWEARDADAEQWPVNPPAPRASNVVQLQNHQPGQPFSVLTSNELRLHGVYTVLKQSKNYQPLMHIGWRQPGLPQRSAPAVAIPRGWMPASTNEIEEPRSSFQDLDSPALPDLHGVIRLYRERYLHVEVDLRYLQDKRTNSTLQEPPLLPIYVHQQKREMRSSELHYLDHPVLGVLVQVTPVEGGKGGTP